MKRQTANKWMSWYILLRDAIKLAEERPGINTSGLYEWCECCTCHKMINRFDKKTQAGHFMPKGHGGSSGAYYDERNVHAQCQVCNEYEEGNTVEYYKFMVKTYGEEMIEALRKKHKLPRPRGSIDMAGIYFREEYKILLSKYGLETERRRRKVGKRTKDEKDE